jgi:hypothetical protein
MLPTLPRLDESVEAMVDAHNGEPCMTRSLPDTSNWPVLGILGRNTYQVSDSTVDMRRPLRAVRGLQLRAQPQNVVLDLARSALLIVDMQNDFCALDGWIASMGIDVSPARLWRRPINRTTQRLRAYSVPIIWLNWRCAPTG